MKPGVTACCIGVASRDYVRLGVEGIMAEGRGAMAAAPEQASPLPDKHGNLKRKGRPEERAPPFVPYLDC